MTISWMDAGGEVGNKRDAHAKRFIAKPMNKTMKQTLIAWTVLLISIFRGIFDYGILEIRTAYGSTAVRSLRLVVF